MGQADAAHEDVGAAGKAEEARGRPGALGIDLGEQAGDQHQTRIAEQAAVAVMQGDPRSTGSEESATAMHMTAIGASATLNRMAPGGRPVVTSCSAQNSGGSRAKMPASPVICMRTSATMAPGAPSRLLPALPVARARIGSMAVQLSRLAPIGRSTAAPRNPAL